MKAYYNEFDPQAAAWLRELIKQGHIAPGDVDERSIEDVTPDELVGYNQCHFFAGIGVWSYALRLAGVSDSTEVWTGSCPCQPFSAAGKGKGFDDERHLWPAWQWLIQQRRPSRIYGEQVASKATEPWLDLVQADLEAMGYAFGCVAFPSAGVGAPHMRDRAFWVGDAIGQRLEGYAGNGNDRQKSGRDNAEPGGPVAETGGAGRVGNTLRDGDGPAARASNSEEEAADGINGRTARPGVATGQPMSSFSVADTEGGRQPERRNAPQPRGSGHTDSTDPGDAPGPTNGFWRDADWLLCRDGKWRPVRPGTFPLANGAPARVGRLRGYGNAINAEAARAFIESVN